MHPEGERIVTLGYFNRDDGLDMGVARALTVDGQGRIWVGGNSGASEDPPLNYFDGESHPDGLAWQSDEGLNQALSGLDVVPSVSSLLAGRDGILWIGLEDGEVLRWDGSDLDRFSLQAPETAEEPVRDRRVLDLLRDREEQLWAAAGEKGLFRFDEGQENWLPVDVAGIGAAVKSVVELSDGTLWVGGDHAVAMSRDGGQTWTLAGQDLGENIGSLVEDALGQVWAGSYGQGVSVYQDQTWHSLQR